MHHAKAPLVIFITKELEERIFLSVRVNFPSILLYLNIFPFSYTTFVFLYIYNFCKTCFPLFTILFLSLSSL